MLEHSKQLKTGSVADGSDLALPLDTAGHEELFSQHREEERLAILRRTQESGRLENLGLLAAGVAHDFNNLLSIIIGNVGLVEMETAHLPKVSDQLLSIKKASERATELCRQLLKYVHRGTGAKAPFDLHLLLHDAVSLLNAYTKIVKIHFTLAAEPVWATGDVVQLRQIIMNLLINAAEAMEGRNGNIRISTERVNAICPINPGEPAKAFIKLKVQDDGQGMTPEVKAQIFAPFFTTKPSGTGIGLSAAVAIMRDHGGSIEVSSEVNVGTVFTILIPLKADVPASARNSSRGKILIVDDWEPLREMMEQVVRSIGFEVDGASSGAAAVALHINLVGCPYVAVLLDLTMPHMDGATTLAALRRSGLKAPVILMSGIENSPMLKRMAADNYANFLKKPLTAEALITAVDQILPLPIDTTNRPASS